MIKKITDYSMITLVIYASGSIFFIEQYYSIAIPLLLACIFILSISHGKMHFSRRFIAVQVLLSMLMGITIVLNKDWHVTSYIAIMCQFITANLVAEKYRYSYFMRIFSNIMLFFALVSLVCYVIILVYPQFMLLFPKTEGSISLDHYNAFIYVFERAKGYNSFVAFTRNNGIFWEPGAYQAFLNMALFYTIESKSSIDSHSDIIKIIVFVITILTTFSITGYIIMVLIICFHLSTLQKTILKSKYRIILLLTSIIVVSSAVIVVIRTQFISEKLSYSFTTGYITRRLYLDDILDLIHNPITWLGLSFSSYSGESANSIIHTAITLGIPFTCILLYMYYRYIKQHKKQFVLAIILVLIMSTESLLWRPFFLCLASFGLVSMNKENEYLNS